MKFIKIFLTLLCLIITTVANADVASQALNKVSEKISNLIPGEGITEVSLDYNDGDEDQLNFSILGVRDIETTDNSNFFTQFSLMNQEINSSGRIIGNIGLGYRKLSEDKNFMFGANTFYDIDLTDGQDRLGLGIEARGSILDFNANRYQKISNSEIVDGDREQVLSGWDYNLTSQIPRAPWARINLNGYEWETEKGSQNQKGNIYSLELDVTNSVEIVASLDQSDLNGIDDETSININFVYPPKDKIMVMSDGLSNEMFEKRNMEEKLKEKVKRRNKLVMEIQGSVVVTKK
jgi:hypothetical protein